MKESNKWLFGILCWLVALVIFFPIFWMAITAFKTEKGAYSPDIIFMPTLESFGDVFARSNYFCLRIEFDLYFVRFDNPLLSFCGPGSVQNVLLSDTEDSVDSALDVVDQDDACRWCPASDIHGVQNSWTPGQHIQA